MDSPEEAAYDYPGLNLGVSHPGCPQEPVTPVVTLGCPWLNWVQLLPDPGVFCTVSAELVPSEPLSSCASADGGTQSGEQTRTKELVLPLLKCLPVGVLTQQL